MGSEFVSACVGKKWKQLQQRATRDVCRAQTNPRLPALSGPDAADSSLTTHRDRALQQNFRNCSANAGGFRSSADLRRHVDSGAYGYDVREIRRTSCRGGPVEYNCQPPHPDHTPRRSWNDHAPLQKIHGRRLRGRRLTR
jgi:hypothetical protein